MTHPLSPYLAPLLAFGPLFMTGRRLPYPGEPFAISLVLGALPYVGAAADVRMKVAASQSQ
jgi:hypothetical protein